MYEYLADRPTNAILRANDMTRLNSLTKPETNRLEESDVEISSM